MDPLENALTEGATPISQATAGELWAEEVLRELRDASFVPAAWARFLGRSFAQARLQRQERRRQHRQTLALGGAGLLLWIAVVASGRPWLGLIGACWWTLVLLMLVWHLGMLERPDGRPLRGLGASNLMTLLRAAVVPLLLAVPPGLLAALLLGAGVSDVVDGWYARRADEVSRLGRWLDPAVDGFVIGAAAVAAARLQLLPVWAGAVVLARYLLPWLVVAVAYFVRARAPNRDGNVSGRLPGAVLVAGLFLAALRLPGATPVVLAGAGGGLLTFGLTVARALRGHAQLSGVPEEAGAPSLSASARPSGNS